MKNRSEYINAIKMMLKSEGIEATNAANHAALEKGLIDLPTFQAAAQVLVKAFLNN